jgi:hypothetical protein
MALHSWLLMAYVRGAVYTLSSVVARLAAAAVLRLVSEPPKDRSTNEQADCSQYEQAYRSEHRKLLQLISEFRSHIAEIEWRERDSRHDRDSRLLEYDCLVKELNNKNCSLQRRIEDMEDAYAQLAKHVCSGRGVCEGTESCSEAAGVRCNDPGTARQTCTVFGV